MILNQLLISSFELKAKDFDLTVVRVIIKLKPCVAFLVIESEPRNYPVFTALRLIPSLRLVALKIVAGFFPPTFAAFSAFVVARALFVHLIV